MRRSITSLILCSFAGTMALTAAQATMPVTYQFKVRITQQDQEGMCPPAGRLMPLRITVDRAFAVTPPKDHTETYHGGPAYNLPSPILSVSFNNATPMEPIMDDIYVSKNDKGTYSYTFLGSDFSQGVTINFSTQDSRSVPNYRLPPSITPKNFTTHSFRFETKAGDCIGDIVAR